MTVQEFILWLTNAIYGLSPYVLVFVITSTIVRFIYNTISGKIGRF